MPGTNFIDKTTVITAVYMNGVDAAIYDAIGDGVSPPTSPEEVKTNLALNNVNNTSDTNKPVSVATQTALNLKADTTYVDSQDALKSNITTTVTKDSSTGAAHIPAGTTAQRPLVPAFGDTRANSDDTIQEWWNGSAWVQLGGMSQAVAEAAFLQVDGGNQMLAPLVFDANANSVLKVGATSVAQFHTTCGIPFMKNKLINGEVTRINQRGVANWAAVANGAYGYDRWKKIDASNMTQIIEAGNFRPNTVHTLSGIGVTTQQITSPASGKWQIPNIPIAATNVQVEEGLEATPFEVRHIGFELGLCQRYYENTQIPFWAAGNIAGAVQCSYQFSTTKCGNPTVSFIDTDGNADRVSTYTSGGAKTSTVCAPVAGGTAGFTVGVVTADIAISARWVAAAEL